MQQVFQKYVSSVLGARRGRGKVAYGRVYKYVSSVLGAGRERGNVAYGRVYIYGSKRLYHMPVGEGRVGQ